jgi:hypothetical protein
MHDQDPMSDDLRELIMRLKPAEFATILGSMKAYIRAEAVIERTWNSDRIVLTIKEVRRCAHVGQDTAQAAVRMAHIRHPKPWKQTS